MKKILFLVTLLLSTFAVFAQEASSTLKAKVTAHSITVGIVGTLPAIDTGVSYYSGSVTGGPYTPLTPCTNLAPAVKCVLTGLPASTTFFLVATAFCPTCAPSTISAFSNQVTAVTLPDAPPTPAPPVLGTPVVAGLPPVVRLTWELAKMNVPVMRQFVQRQQVKTGNWVSQKQLTPSTTSFIDSTVKRGNLYPYRIEVVPQKGAVMVSNVETASVPTK